MMKLTITKNRILYIVLAYVTIIYMQPFFAWKSYSTANVFNSLGYVGIIIVTLLSLSSAMARRRINRTSFNGLLILLILVGYVYFVGEHSQMGSIGVLFQYLMIISIALLDPMEKTEFFSMFRKVFAILMIIPMVMFFLRLLNIGIPYSLLADYRADSNRIYLHYPLTVFMASIYSTHLPVMRLCAFLDEPGYLGTIIMLLLAGDGYDLKKNENKILFLAGLMTLSTAFFVVTVVYFIIMNKETIFAPKRRKYVIITLVLIALGVFFITTTDAGNKLIDILFSKLQTGDLRNSQTILSNTVEAYKENILYLLFGHGYYSYTMSYSSGGYSWGMLLYDIGIFGMLLTVVYVLFFGKVNRFSKQEFLFRMIMLASIFQRPYIVTIPYVVIFVFGLSNLVYKSDEIEQAMHTI